MPEIASRLEAGGSAADVGCGNGGALITLARTFPHATRVDFDLHAPVSGSAWLNAEKA